ncbi:MAG: hypothetical protein IT375_35615 [Polyangiaceae bacterium]|nr:hypothetical protein [Polyangiaceae bacterium]
MAWSRIPVIVALAWAASGCASDAVDPPEPTLETGGSFVASEQAPGEVVLYRMFGSLHLENGETVLIMKRFAQRSQSFAQAEALAKQRDLTIDVALMSAPRSEFVTLPWRVVWYRTLDDQERDALY